MESSTSDSNEPGHKAGQKFNESGPTTGQELNESAGKIGQDESGHEDDDEEILNTWLGELNTLKKGLKTSSDVAYRKSSNVSGGGRKSEYRRSLINIDQTQDDELDAILGELSQLENQFSKEIFPKSPTARDPPSRPVNNSYQYNSSTTQQPNNNQLIVGGYDQLPPGGGGYDQLHSGGGGYDHISQGGVGVFDMPGGSTGSTGGVATRNCSPADTDSAFCDNLSVLSSSSATSSTDKKSSGTSSGHSSGGTTVTLHTTQSTSPASPASPASSNSGQNNHVQREDDDARMKAEKIKIAIEKIKEASVKKLFIKVFTSDGSAKSLLVDEKMNVGQVTRLLAEKNHVQLDPKWSLVELVPDLYMERVYEDHEQLVENLLLWKVDSKNTLWFIERPEKFDLFLRPERYLLGTNTGRGGQLDLSMEEHSRAELIEEYFSAAGVIAPQIEGFIWLKTENKKTWKRCYAVLRSSGLYYSTKGATGKKNSKDLLCLCTFDVNQVYYGVGWKRKFKAPTDFCFGVKHPQIQAKNPKYIRYVCVDTQRELHQWVTGIRIAKNGQNLHQNFRGLVDEITHADLDILVGKRGSFNSTLGLIHTNNKADSCATNLNLHSPILTPMSENKSFDSALSSGINSDLFKECIQSSAMELDKFDLRLNGGIGGIAGTSTPISTLNSSSKMKRTSKSSSSLSDKSSVELGFESDHQPAGGTIKKRPATNFSMSESMYSYKDYSEADDRDSLAAAVANARRSNSAERLNSNGRNYDELQQLLDELHTNVKQAKDIQAKIKSSINSSDGSTPERPPSRGMETPPPPPPRTSSRLSIDEDYLPPPPPELQSSFDTTSTLGRRKQLPPIAPKPNFRIPSSPNLKPPSYGTLPNMSKKGNKIGQTAGSKLHRTASGRRISFDDNIQLIDESSDKSLQGSESGLNKSNGGVSDDFLIGLEKVVSSRLPGDFQVSRGHSLSPSPLRGPMFNPPPCPLRLNYLQQTSSITNCHSPVQGDYRSPVHGDYRSPLQGDYRLGNGDRNDYSLLNERGEEPLYTAVVKPGRPRAPSLSSACSRSTRLSQSPSGISGLPGFSQRAVSCSPDKFMPRSSPGTCSCCAQPMTCKHSSMMSCSTNNVGFSPKALSTDPSGMKRDSKLSVPRALGSSPNQSQVCCVGKFRCEGSADSSPEQNRNTYKRWREGDNSSEYWSMDKLNPTQKSSSNSPALANSKPKQSGPSKLWGSLRGRKSSEKRQFSPHQKSAS